MKLRGLSLGFHYLLYGSSALFISYAIFKWFTVYLNTDRCYLSDNLLSACQLSTSNHVFRWYCPQWSEWWNQTHSHHQWPQDGWKVPATYSIVEHQSNYAHHQAQTCSNCSERKSILLHKMALQKYFLQYVILSCVTGK